MPTLPRTHRTEADRERTEEMRQARRHRTDERRGSSADRGYGHKWRKYREAWLARHPLCVTCLDNDVVTQADVVDHIVPHRGDWKLFWDPKNHQSLCVSCHNVKSGGEAHDLFMPDVLPSKPELTIVSGPPAGGKSTWVGAHAGPFDAVICLDQIAERLSRKRGRAALADPQLRREALQERNRMLRGLSTCNAERAFFIVTAAALDVRDRWSVMLRPARRVVAYAPLSVCKARIEADPERAEVARAQIKAAERWHAKFSYSESEEIVGPKSEISTASPT